MTTDQTTPATKQDLLDFRNATDKNLLDFMKHIDGTMAHMYSDMQAWKEELRLHFDVVVENLKHDLFSARHDDIESLKTRVTRLERKTGIR